MGFMALVATAAIAKAVATKIKILLIGDTANLKGFRNHLMNAILHLLNLLHLHDQKVISEFKNIVQ